MLRPLRDLGDLFGTGIVDALDPSAVLQQSSRMLDGAASLARTALHALPDSWAGAPAEAALDKGRQAQVSAVELSERGDEIGAVTRAATASVERGNVELGGIAQSFLAFATATAPVALTPPGQIALLTSAAEHVSAALAVVARTRGELLGYTTAMNALAAPIAVPAPVAAPGLPLRPTSQRRPREPWTPSPARSVCPTTFPRRRTPRRSGWHRHRRPHDDRRDRTGEHRRRCTGRRKRRCTGRRRRRGAGRGRRRGAGDRGRGSRRHAVGPATAHVRSGDGRSCGRTSSAPRRRPGHRTRRRGRSATGASDDPGDRGEHHRRDRRGAAGDRPGDRGRRRLVIPSPPPRRAGRGHGRRPRWCP
ncbi:hypothetical protein ACYAFX_12910 [Rhodococcus aetherivorans]